MHMLCTICSDLVSPAENIYTTKCGHIFHHHCLAQWIERSQSCPQCRNKVTKKCMFRVYPTISSEVTGEDAATLQSRLDNAQLQVREQAAAYKEKEDKLVATVAELRKQEEVVKSLEKKLVTQHSAVSALKEQLEYVKIQNKETQKLKDEHEALKKHLLTLTGLQKVLNATSDDVEQMLQGYTDVRTVATFATALKRALCESEAKKNEVRDRLQAVKQQLGVEKMSCADWQTKFMQVQESLSNAERKLEALKNKRKASEFLDDSFQSVKIQRVSDFDERLDDTFGICGSNISLNTMVNKIENADSPYFNLKQSSLALATLQRPAAFGDTKLKPSEFAILKSARNTATKKVLENVPTNIQKTGLSIFHRKEPVKLDLEEKPVIDLDISYDGLGGHSKLDKFPVPRNNVLKFKSSVPKLTSKHRLKKPASNDNQDIGVMLEKIRNK